MLKFIERSTLAALIVLITGCAGGPQVKKEVFAKPQTLAVITLGGAVHGIYTSEEVDTKILNDSAPTCLSELAKSSNIRLVPAKSVLSSKVYASIKDDGPMFSTLLLAGYKRFSPEDEKIKLKALAKEVRADGFLISYLSYAKSESGLSIGFGGLPLNVGSVKPALAYTLKAVNADGEVIWSDNINIDGEEGITTVMGIGGYSSLIPKLNAITRTACQKAVQNLADKLAAK
jgi:hypothetical protein